MSDDSPKPLQHPEYYRRVRVITCELLSVWRMFAEVEVFLWGDTPNDRIVKKLPFIYKNYLQLDDAKLAQIERYYNNSLQGVKDIDVVLFYNLEDKLFNFRRAVDEVLKPLLRDRQIHYFKENAFLKDLLREFSKGLENSIKQTVAYLPQNEQEPITKIIDEHWNRIQNPPEEEIPQFVLGLVNNMLPQGKYVVAGDVKIFMKQNTVFWFIEKMIETGFYEMFLSNSIGGIFATVADMTNKDFSMFDKVAESNQFKEKAKYFRLTQQEIETHFYNNKPFYKFFLGFIKLMEGHIPFSFKRKVMELNNGKHNPNDFLRKTFPNPDEVIDEVAITEVEEVTSEKKKKSQSKTIKGKKKK